MLSLDYRKETRVICNGIKGLRHNTLQNRLKLRLIFRTYVYLHISLSFCSRIAWLSSIPISSVSNASRRLPITYCVYGICRTARARPNWRDTIRWSPKCSSRQMDTQCIGTKGLKGGLKVILLCLWNVQNSTCEAELEGHYSVVTNVQFSLDG